MLELDNKIEIIQEELEDAEALHQSANAKPPAVNDDASEHQAEDASFMSESIYEKLPPVSPKRRRPKPNRRKSMPVLHEHLEPGSNIRTIPAHNDCITSLDFDMPFGTMVTAALDDTVRVWDLNLGRCMGLLEGHTASVRCLQVEENIVATGSLDASIRLWDLSRAKYEPYENNVGEDDDDDGLGFGNADEDAPPPPPANSMEDCPLFVLEAHVDEVTALHLRGDTLVSGSADKTLRQWDLAKGRCVQTLDVLWAAAQASATLMNPVVGDASWKPTSGRTHDANADFVGAIQCFDAALACGTADGMVRLWDLRSGQVHRSLVGHTGPVTCLQFDDMHLVTGSADRSIRVSSSIPLLLLLLLPHSFFSSSPPLPSLTLPPQIWDLRTGSIFDAYAYDHPITSMMFDARRIVAAAGETNVKVYDKTDGRHWDCGPGVAAEEDEEGGGSATPAVVERVRIRDGYMVEGRKDGVLGVWTC